MKLEIRPIKREEMEQAIEILVLNFAEDKGMAILFRNNDPHYRKKLRSWFRATLKMLLRSKQLVLGAYQKDELCGLAIMPQANYKHSFLSLANWTIRVFYSCGYTTIKRTMMHDRSRKPFISPKRHFILEFIGVHPQSQAKGIGKSLFQKLQSHAAEVGKSIWLETTKPKNIRIFEKVGFKLKDEYTEMGIRYYVMTNETKTAET